ncbi:MAG: polysaccharide biosynthesis protein [Oscillospiraceae bacterium]|nr:polysaccharide biosynthesis protein [Oscillospiraceae bacterium]
MLKKKRITAGLLVQRAFLPLLDIVFANAAFWAAAALVNNFHEFPADLLASLRGREFYVTLIFPAIFFLSRLYRSLWKYAGTDELVQLAGATALADMLSYIVDRMFELSRWNITRLPTSLYFIAWLLILSLSGGARLSYRLVRRSRRGVARTIRRADGTKRVMIVGAGEMGYIVIKELRANYYRDAVPVVIVDDNPAKQGSLLVGTPIRGGCDKIPEIAEHYRVDEIMICIPTASEQRRQEIVRLAIGANRPVKISPSLREMKESGEAAASLSQLRHVSLEDLLMRPEVQLDPNVCAYLGGQTVLVTGGGGSIGSEICRQVARYHPGRIVIFDVYENNAFSLKNSLDQQYGGAMPQVEIRIGSVRDKETLRRVFGEFRPTVVFHAAAHKHVPLMENNPCEAVKNNVFGTLCTAETAMEFGVQRFVLLSTDKAVNPSSVMGATKRVTELIIQRMARRTKETRFAAVRFGNVLGSNGSVIPVFQEQIRAGGPVTVTHPEITRYFMTIPEAAQLVVQTGGLSRGGEIFVLDMGQPVRILTMAEELIRLTGLRPYEDIPIEITGLRPGEKLHEELSLEEEIATRSMTENNKIFVTYPVSVQDEQLDEGLERLRHSTPETVRDDLRILVPNYQER